ncbi:hypothetical protein EXIGLDRAFT_732111 [Exidia glandulosa HHB12029]|uniref:Serine-threonine/tyrosine-protein kinase catalytic domain-containing protein n=1 Tax=Exidia glandulosa HHB12029 TaxID=1314781 RepID=A0A165BM21_EXIGL|nr:hypothetical protein EXIGLDRAFT_732111 [Exidia glandulosa HHB12029]
MVGLSRHEPPLRPGDMSDAIWAIASRCFNPDPARRPSATEVAAQLRRLLSVRVVQSSPPEQVEPSSSTLVAQDVPMEM